LLQLRAYIQIRFDIFDVKIILYQNVFAVEIIHAPLHFNWVADAGVAYA
jgi:hypothetical protein